MSGGDIDDFFARYRAAFDALDGEAVAALWRTPCAISQAGVVTWWSEPEPMRDNMLRLCEVYRQAGFASCTPRIETVLPLGAHDAFVRVDWTLKQADGSTLQRFHTGYHLQREPGGAIRVLMCTAYEEDLQALKKPVAA